MLKDRPDRVRAYASAGALAMACSLSPLVLAIAPQGGGDSRESQTSRSEQVFTTVCGRCHPIERVTAVRRTLTEWEETIDAMITARGAQVSDDDYDVVLTYLAQAYGRVEINRAPVEEIGAVLEIAEDVAAAIVAHRKEHGPYADVESLLKVRGLTRDVVEKKREAITF